MSLDLTGRWSISQVNVSKAKYTGTLTLRQRGWKVVGEADWQNHPDGTIIGAIVGTTISFTIIYPGGLIGHYAAELLADGKRMTRGVCISDNDSGTWEATRV